MNRKLHAAFGPLWSVRRFRVLERQCYKQAHRDPEAGYAFAQEGNRSVGFSW